MDGYRKTDSLQLNIIEPDNIVDIEVVTENFEIVERAISNIQLTDTKIDVVGENKKLNVVIDELKRGNKSTSDRIDSLKIDDEHVDVVSKRMKLNVYLSGLERLIGNLKAESDRNHRDFQELNRIVDNSTERDRIANDRHYSAISKINALIG